MCARKTRIPRLRSRGCAGWRTPVCARKTRIVVIITGAHGGTPLQHSPPIAPRRSPLCALRLLCELCAFIAKRERMFQVPLNPPLDPQGRFHSKAEKEPSTFPAPQGEGPGVGSVISRFQSCTIKPMNSNLSSNIVQRSTRPTRALS